MTLRMGSNRISSPKGQSRREFLGAAAAGAVAAGMPTSKAEAAKRNPKRGGTVRFATRSDSRGLDPHRNVYYNVSHPLAGTSMGLMDLNAKMEPVPGLAVGYEVSKDLKTYTFSLRKGATFHNGADVDAEAIKWNIERIKRPEVGLGYVRAAVRDVDTVTAVDKWTVRFHLKVPSAVLVPNLTYFPLQFLAPNAEETADTHPVGCGPFKFKSWKKFRSTVLERFENWYETDAQGNALPYLDKIVGLPKKEDRVRLTALRTGEVDLIDNMAYADADSFRSNHADRFNTWDVPQVGTSYLGLNVTKGPFALKNPHGKLLRQAVAHAINQDAIHQAIFSGLGSTANGFYSSASPWYMPGLERKYGYDPDKSRYLVKKAGAVGEPVRIVSRNDFVYQHQTGELIQAMLGDVGFKVNHEIITMPVMISRMRKDDFELNSNGISYRADPDSYFGRNVHSEAPMTKWRTGFVNERADKLVFEAKITKDRQRRLELYQAVEEIVHEEVPMVYLHYIPLLEAGVKKLRGYTPAFAGPYSIQGGGLRTAWMES